jgi:hypothetical protein
MFLSFGSPVTLNHNLGGGNAGNHLAVAAHSDAAGGQVDPAFNLTLNNDRIRA